MAAPGEEPIIPRRGWTGLSEKGGVDSSVNLSVGMNARELERNMESMKDISREIERTAQVVLGMVTSTKDQAALMKQTTEAAHATAQKTHDIYASTQKLISKKTQESERPSEAIQVQTENGIQRMIPVPTTPTVPLPAAPSPGGPIPLNPAPGSGGAMDLLRGMRGDAGGILQSRGFAYMFPGAQMLATGVQKGIQGATTLLSGSADLSSAEGLASLGEGVAGIGAGIGTAAYGVYKGISTAAELSTKYGALTGDTGMSGAVGYEVRARMLALSPWISSQQGRDIVEKTLGAGYSGTQADTVMDYLAQNIRNGMTDIGQSLDLYKLGVQQAGATTSQMTTQLQNFQDTAKNTQASVAGLQAGFTANLQSLTTVGASGVSAVAAAGSMAQLGATSGMGQAYAGYTGPDTSNMAFRFFMSQQYGVPVWQLPAAMSGGNIPGTADATTQGIIGRLLPNYQNMSADQIANSPEMMWLPQYLQSTGALTDPTILNDPNHLARWIKGMAPGGRFTSQYQVQHEWDKYHVSNIGFLHQRYAGEPTTMGFTGRVQEYLTSHGVGGDIGYAGEAAVTGKTNPFIEQLIRHGQMNDLFLKDKNGLVSVEDYLRDNPNVTFDQMKNFHFYTPPSRFGGKDVPSWARVGLLKSLYSQGALGGKGALWGGQTMQQLNAPGGGLTPDEMGASSAAAAGQQVTIGLTPQAAKVIKVVNQQYYGQGASNSSTTGQGS